MVVLVTCKYEEDPIKNEGARVVTTLYSSFSDAQTMLHIHMASLNQRKPGVHQGSVLSPLLFIIVLEALSREFRTGCPWELLYADDLMISAGSMEELLVKVKTWKTEMEKKGLRVNMGKTKIMESGINLDVLKKSGKYPCGVCLTGVGRTNAIQCDGCKCWVHKKCSGIKGGLLRESEFMCA